jgi:hypothetical protein
MAAQTIHLAETQAITLATTLTELVFGPGVAVIYIACADPVYLCLDDGKSDGAAVDTAQVFTVPAGVVFPVPASGKTTLVAAVSGTPTLSCLGV